MNHGRSIRRVLLGLGVAGAMAPLACGAPAEDAPELRASNAGVVEVGLVLGEDALQVVSLADPRPPVDDPAKPPTMSLHWELRDGARIVAAGDAADPRLVSGEVLVRGALAPFVTRATSAPLVLTLPNVGGTLAIVTGDQELSATLPVLASGSRFRSFVSPANDATLRPRAAGSNAAPSFAAPEKILDGGPCAPLTLLVMPEGFTEAEMGSFHAKAEALVGGLTAVSGFDVAGQLEVYRADLPSRESGLSEIGKVMRDTAWNVHYGVAPDDRRAIRWSSTSPVAIAAQQSAMTAANLNQGTALVVLVNSNEPLGASVRGMRTVVLSASADASRSLAHELGHALGNLADEYDYGDCKLELAGLAANTTKNPNAPPWAALLASPPVEGADLCKRGVFRPQDTCMMRALEHDFCPVCLAKLDSFFARRRAAQPPSCRTKGGCTVTEALCIKDEDCNLDGGAGRLCIPSPGSDADVRYVCASGAGCRN